MPDIGLPSLNHLGALPTWTTDLLLLAGDALSRLRELPDRSVNAVVTSPPYFNLRKGAAGAVGNEATPSEYVASLVAIFREVRRVLRDDGSCWIVVGDLYAATLERESIPSRTPANSPTCSRTTIRQRLRSPWT